MAKLVRQNNGFHCRRKGIAEEYEPVAQCDLVCALLRLEFATKNLNAKLLGNAIWVARSAHSDNLVRLLHDFERIDVHALSLPVCSNIHGSPFRAKRYTLTGIL